MPFAFRWFHVFGSQWFYRIKHTLVCKKQRACDPLLDRDPPVENHWFRPTHFSKAGFLPVSLTSVPVLRAQTWFGKHCSNIWETPVYKMSPLPVWKYHVLNRSVLWIHQTLKACEGIKLWYISWGEKNKATVWVLFLMSLFTVGVKTTRLANHYVPS